MTKNYLSYLLLSGLFMTGKQVEAQFSGAFAPANWSLTNTSMGSDASVNTGGAPASITFTGNDSNFGDCCGLYDDYTVNIPANCGGGGVITFNYNFSQPDIEEFYYVVNGSATFVTGSTQSGSVTANVIAGGTFAFRILSDDDCCGVGVLTVTNFTYTEADITGPVANLASLADVSGTCSVNAPAAPTAVDACTGTITGTTGTTFPITTIGTTVVTWSYNDGAGNITTQNQNIIVTDLAPAPDAVSLADVTVSCSANMPVAPTATDDCAGTITGTTATVFPITALGTTVVTWTYDDGNGNTITQDQNIIVTDVAPVPDLASLADITYGCSASLPTAPTATDDCAGAITGTTTAVFPITTLGTTIITWTYDDGSGNISTQDQNIIVTNTLALTATTTIENIGNDGAIDLTVSGNTGTVTFDWDNDGTGDNDDTEDLTGLTSGIYNVIATDGGCSATLAVVIENAGLSENELAFVVYPNPTNGIINLEFGNGSVHTIYITDNLGRLVYAKAVTNDVMTVDLSQFENGIYTIQGLNENESVFTTRIIKK